MLVEKQTKSPVVMKHFPLSELFSSTRSHGTSQSLETRTKSPGKMSSHLMSVSTLFRTTVTIDLLTMLSAR